MRKILSIAAIAALATSSFAASDIAGAFKEGKASGQIRAMYIGNDVDTGMDSSAFALGGKLAYETAPLYGISAGAAFYTTNDLGTKDKNDAKVDGSLYDENKKSYTLLGQAYLVGQFAKTTVKVGRQQLDTPLAGSDDVRMVPNLFEAALVINTDLPNTTLIGGYVARMAGWDSWSDRASRSQFQSMSRSALGSTVDLNVRGSHIGDNGVYVVAAVNNSVKDLTLQAWDYYAVDVVNAVYLQADYKMGVAKDMALTLQGQFYNIEGIGETKDLLSKAGLGKVDYSVYGAKASLSTPFGLTPYVAYNGVSDDSKNLAVFGAWGGYPEFAVGEEFWYNSIGYPTQSMNGAGVFKVGADYSLESLGLGARTIGVAYTNFDLKDKYNANTNTDTSSWDVIYTCNGALLKNLDAKLTYSSIDSKDNTRDKSVFKAIFNYNF